MEIPNTDEMKKNEGGTNKWKDFPTQDGFRRTKTIVTVGILKTRGGRG